MSKFDEIIGQKEIITHIKNAKVFEKVSNAYIIEGEKGAGKETIARYFAALLNCEENLDKPCEKCHSCIQALSNNQPDIITVEHKKESVITVDEVREQLVVSMEIRPYSSKYKIYIVPDADKMNAQAQNAILKTIEEPPEYGIVILLVENKEKMLQTILSRCVKLTIKPINNKIINDYFISKNYDESEIKKYINFANGNIGKLRYMLDEDKFREIYKEAVDFLKTIDSKNLYDIEEVRLKLREYKDDIEEYLSFMIMWYRDILVFKTTKKTEGLFCQEYINEIEDKARKYSYKKINDSIEMLEKTLRRINNNVSFDLITEVLFIELRK